jgi:hypothetical protein
MAAAVLLLLLPLARAHQQSLVPPLAPFWEKL